MLLPGFAKDVLNAGPDDLGLLISLSGIGSLLGSLYVASFGNRKRARLLLIGGLLMGLSLLGFAWSTHFWLSIVLLTVVGFGQASRMSLSNVLIQSYVDDDFRGRVMSIYMLEMAFLSIAIYPISLFADYFGPHGRWAIRDGVSPTYPYSLSDTAIPRSRLVLVPISLGVVPCDILSGKIQVIGIGREPMGAHFHIYGNSQDAHNQTGEQTALARGQWTFNLYDHQKCATGLAQHSAGWRGGPSDPVPHLWTMDDAESDQPIYTNVRMPFRHEPPRTPRHNPTGIYRCWFDVEEVDGRTLINLEGIENCYEIALNGEWLGFNKDARYRSF